ncbi:MAG TPA: SH3 domain-containing protein, partial [Fibrobacteria bacterium]|nr:SH3 domain-containing protein [Fibrobacteria bacterium]
MAPKAVALAFSPLPENPSAFSGCTAKVKVNVARLRSGPSLDARILGVRLQDESVHVRSVHGKWVQVSLPGGDTAFMAAYLLAFPYHDLLEQWKRETPSPSVGKKAKVKWASVRFRKYPSADAPRLGGFVRGDEV